MKIYIFTLIAIFVIVGIFGVYSETSAADTRTFVWNDIYNQTYPGVPSFHQGGKDGTFYANQATADKVCQLKGYASASSFITDRFYSCGDNYYIKWDGSSWVQFNACQSNLQLQTLTCSRPSTPVTPPTPPTPVNKCEGPNTLPNTGITFTRTANIIEGGTNTLAVSAHNNDNATKTVFYTKYQCRCRQHVGNRLYGCDFFWSGESDPPLCQNTNEILTLGPYETKTIQVSVTQFQNMSCGSLQTDFSLVSVNNYTLPGNEVDRLIGCAVNDLAADCQLCSSHASKRCVGNSVYWFNSCGNQEEIFQQCQTCSNGQCVNITCSSNADCGTNGYVGNPFCQSGNVYQNYRTYTCNNPGTANSSCTNSSVAQLKNTCPNNQTCSNGQCANIACDANSDCGTSGYIGDPFCQGNSVFKNYKTYTCSNPGTVYSACSNSTEARLQNACSANQTCSNGNCVNADIACDSNSDCGTNGYIGSPFCRQGDVYRTYKTYTCSNPGSANSSCSNSTEDRLVTNCASNQVCSDGQCQNEQIACSCSADCGTSGYTGNPFCQSGNVYQNYKTYTCLNPGTSNSTCSDSTQTRLKENCSYNQTCSNGQCSSNCTQYSERRCVGNSVYWFDSCGNQGTLIQDCYNIGQTCQNGYCTQQYSNLNVQTNSATNISNNQATLNGYLYNQNPYYYTGYYYASVWFQYGQNYSYGYETSHQTQSSSGSFSQNISGLAPNTTYRYRAVAQGYNSQLVYGQEMTFTTSGGGYYGNIFNVAKNVINLSSGNLGWSSYAAAKPSDILNFKITIQANQTANNVVVRDVLSSNLICRNNITVDGITVGGDIQSGINIGNLYQGQTKTIIFEAQVQGPQNFSYGTTSLINYVYVTSSEGSANSSATVSVTKSGLLGAIEISTGLTNNLLADSLILPLILGGLGIWLFKLNVFGIPEWINGKKTALSRKRLEAKIVAVRKKELSSSL